MLKTSMTWARPLKEPRLGQSPPARYTRRPLAMRGGRDALSRPIPVLGPMVARALLANGPGRRYRRAFTRGRRHLPP
jgi:hypothetical protein